MTLQSTNILQKRWQFAIQRRHTREREVQDISDLLYPTRGDITTKRTPGSRRINGIFDSTGMRASITFANWLKSSVIPTHTDWLRCKPPHRLRHNIEARQLCGSIATKTLANLKNSNFYREGGIFLRDLSTLSTATQLTEQLAPRRRRNGSTFGGFEFEALPFSRVWLVNGKGRRIIMWIHQSELPALEAERFFGRQSAGTLVEKHMRAGEELTKLKFVRFLYKNENALSSGLRRPDQMPWISHYHAVNGAELESLRVRGHQMSPYTTARWDIVDGYEYGYGLGDVSRGDVMLINEIKRRVLIAAGVDLSPPILVEDQTVIDLNLDPSGVMVTRPPAKITPQFLHSNARYDVANNIANEERDQVEKNYAGPNINPPSTQPRTAEESQRLRELAAQSLSAPTDVLQDEWIFPSVQLDIELQFRSGELPEVDQLAAMGVDAIELEISSPLFAAQRQAPVVRLEGFLDRWAARANQIGKPQILNRINWDRTLKLSGDGQDIPEETFNTDEEMIVLQEQDRALREQQLRQQALESGAKSAKDIGQAEKAFADSKR